MEVNIKVAGVAAVIFVLFIAGMLFVISGDSLGNIEFIKSVADRIEGLGWLMIVIALIAATILIVVAIANETG